MPPELDQPITTIDEDGSWAALSSMSLGRLVTVVSGEPDVFPVNFVVQRRSIVVRTDEGTKLMGVQINPRVAFEADDHDAEQGWSVVVKGYAHVLSRQDDIAEAERAQVLPWTATPKHRFIRIRPSEITGRRFRFGAEPYYGTELGYLCSDVDSRRSHE
jgi:nitroimidazol reductase NimA-like FMN-containing flavoprotein (pyridoxamine 5'-phosphate oxidase superfamily)